MSRYIFWIATFVSTSGCTILQFCDNGNNLTHKALREAALFFYENRLPTVVALVSLQIFSAIGAAYFTWRSSYDIDKLKRILDSVVDHCFSDMDREKFEYRATIFQIREIWVLAWFIGSWSGIVCRSGETYGRSRTIFLIDKMSRQNSTGVVGHSLFTEGQTVFPDKLLPAGDPKEYKIACNLADVEYNHMNVKSTVVWATGIKRNGKLWGFLVVDSTDDSQFPSQNTEKSKRRAITACAEIIGTLIS